MDSTYGNLLKKYLTDPGSYQSSPGYQFSLDQATAQANRGAAVAGRIGSGGAMAALTKLGAGMASQDYGNTIDRLTRANTGEQQYDLGQGQNANAAESNRLTGVRDSNNFTLGNEQNRLTGVRDSNNYDLGLGQNANTAQRNANDFGLGMYTATNNYNLGHEGNQNTREGNYLSYMLGNDRNNIDAANGENNYNLGAGANAVNWFNANTNRANAQSNSGLDWTKYNASVNPVRRYV